MSWTDERIATLKTMWEAGQTASQIAEALGGVSRNAVIGKAHRLELQARPSPVKPNDPEAKAAAAAEASATAAATAPEPVGAPEPVEVETPKPAPVVPPVVAAAKPAAPVEPEPVAEEPEDDEDEDEDEAAPAVVAPVRTPQPILRSVGPGGFLRQAPGEQQPPSTPAPPRRLVPAKPSPEMANKTSLLELNDRICKWPLGHPGEPDFHFCGKAVNPGFPYCVDHCGHAYQAQLPRRDRRPTPPLPFGGPRPR
ncbi:MULTISPECIES: GcrA family cell cycle regulator [Sphingomonas]|uniref:GcrA family cell cycle regulator n=1 Tax=Sphingomonas TaxID=13687 RepID=UPI001051B6ED|nr:MULTISPECIES: GcrA family cell cycle regulator [Sphingomonas]TCQ10755.1 GcrA cell cycle regulator [Sphingomonas sp. PP-CC-3A-396]